MEQKNLNVVSESSVEQVASVTKKIKRKPFFFNFSFILFVALLVLGYLYYQKTLELKAMKGPLANSGYSEEEIQKVTNEMKSRVLVAPNDEVKILGVIDNPDQLRKEQVFYKDVEKGDYVFVFTVTSRALIWRPSESKVINFGVFEVKNNAPAGPQTAPTTPTSAPKKK